MYASNGGVTNLHLVVWPNEDSLPLETLLMFWGGGAEVIDVHGMTIGYRPAGDGVPAVAWWTDPRGYLVMASIISPTDALDFQDLLVEGRVN